MSARYEAADVVAELLARLVPSGASEEEAHQDSHDRGLYDDALEIVRALEVAGFLALYPETGVSSLRLLEVVEGEAPRWIERTERRTGTDESLAEYARSIELGSIGRDAHVVTRRVTEWRTR